MSVDLRISLKKAEAMCLVVELGGVSRAAERLLVGQPVVSAHIRSLEERVGAKLFYREGRRLHMTEAGQAVYDWASEVLTRTRELERQLDGLSGGKQGTVVLGASMSVGSYRLADVVTAFGAANADASVRLAISDTEHAIEDTRIGALDFAVVVADGPPDLPGMDVEHIGDDEIVLVTAPDGEPAAGEIPLSGLSGLPFIEAPEGIVRRSFVDQQLLKLGVVDRNIVIELGHPEPMKRAVRAGHGVALLFRSSVRDELASGQLREVVVAGIDVVVPIYLISRKRKSFPPLHRELLAQIRGALAVPEGEVDADSQFPLVERTFNQ